jgi:outer membrane receptor protein involved in Fe transport
VSIKPGKVQFTDSTHTFFAPRLALTWHPSGNTYVRAATGSSIAPAYISLLSVPATPPQAPSNPATYYTQQISSGNLQPEEAFSWDVGVDQRLGASNIIVSADLYQNVLRNQFLQSWVANGTYTPPDGLNAGITAPLYNIINGNIGHSMYEGAELSVKRDVQRGFGFNANVSLIRAYAYDLPAGFYDTANGPNTTNLGIIPNTNFNGYGLGISAVPYAQGYAELNYNLPRLKVATGLTYYGNNNTYNEPAFGVLQASVRYDLSKRAYLLVSGNNVTNAYSSVFYNANGGTPVPLVNGQFGATAAGTIGPAYFRFNFHIQTGP